MSESLFTTQTPTGTDNSDGTPGITTGTTWSSSVAGSITGVRFYATVTVSGTYTGALWQPTHTDSDDAGTGTLLASKTLGTTPTSGTWNVITFDTPVTYSTPNTLLRVGLFSGAGRYVNKPSFFGSALTNGDLTAPADGSSFLTGTLRQGVFALSASLTYPTLTFNSSCYFVDVVFEPSGGGGSSISPTGVNVPLAVGTPTLSQTLSISPTGVNVPLAAGTPTLSQTLSISPTGVNVALSVGTPSLAMTISPGGLAVPVSVGTPVLTSDALPPASNAATGSWYQLLDVLYANRQFIAEGETLPPMACPNDGEPLSRAKDGTLYCRYDGWIPPGQRVR